MGGLSARQGLALWLGGKKAKWDAVGTWVETPRIGASVGDRDKSKRSISSRIPSKASPT